MKAGYKIWYCAEARLTHLHNNSGGCRSDKRYRYLFHSFANTAYFLCKYSPRKSARSSTNFWKYRLEYLSRKPLKINSSKMRHDPFAVIAGLCGAGAGLARFFLYGKRIGLPSQILEEQESCK
jgi:GT2 family glycosyltransferase